MRHLGQVAQDGERVGTVGILRCQFAERRDRIAAHDLIEQIQHPSPVGQPEHGADLRRGGLPGPVRDGLIQEAGGVAGRAFGGPGDQGQRVIGNFGSLGGGNAAQQRQHHLRLDPAQIEALAARQHGDRHLADLGGGKDEFDMGRRLLQRFQQRVESVGGQHVHFVDDVDLVARRGGAVVDRVDDFADIADAGARGGVHFHHIDMSAGGDGKAGLAGPARLGGRGAAAVRADAVQPLGDDPGGGGFSGAPNAGHDECLGDPVGGEGIFQGPDHRLLPDQIGKGFRPVFAGEDLVGFGRCGSVWHLASAGFGFLIQ